MYLLLWPRVDYVRSLRDDDVTTEEGPSLSIIPALDPPASPFFGYVAAAAAAVSSLLTESPPIFLQTL